MDPTPESSPPPKPDQPWWNDEDKAGGLFATIVAVGFGLALAIAFVALAVAFAQWLL